MPSVDIRALRKDLEAIEVCLASLKTEVARLEQQAANFKGVIHFYEEGGMESHSPATHNGATSIMEEVAEDIIRKQGNLLHYSTVHKRLVERGVFVKGENPARNTGSHLSLDKARFASWGSGQWGLAEWKTDPSFKPMFDLSYKESQGEPTAKSSVAQTPTSKPEEANPAHDNTGVNNHANGSANLPATRYPISETVGVGYPN